MRESRETRPGPSGPGAGTQGIDSDQRTEAGPVAELFFLPRSGRCCALLSPAAALLGQLMRG